MSVLIETTMGDIVVDLYYKKCPKTTLNFLKLCKIKYYNYCIFHNIQQDYMAQTGDPTHSGQGGECVFSILNHNLAKGKYFEPEFHPKLTHKSKGTVSMAVSGEYPDQVAGSQFFITLEDDLVQLDDRHSIFGFVAEGLEVLNNLNDVVCDQNHVPLVDIRIKHTVILDDPFDDPPNLLIPDKSPEPSESELKSNRLTKQDETNDHSDLDESEKEKRKRAKEAESQALTLEMIGDLPSSEIKPPENVLFVCKLNPLTQEEDLELIFSRFGELEGCEIIKDKTTNASLGYAFIEYADKKSCELAYLKMNNVLIDDRRIHVDFSQSVSRVQNNWLSNNKSKSFLKKPKVDKKP